jgi:hypothetical protein
VSRASPDQVSLADSLLTVYNAPGLAHGLGPLCRGVSPTYVNLLALSSLLRTKQLTKGYYASLALAFKLVWSSLNSSLGLNPDCTAVRHATVTHACLCCYSTHIWPVPIRRCSCPQLQLAPQPTHVLQLAQPEFDPFGP